MDKYLFRRRCAYAGAVDFEVHGAGFIRCLGVQREAIDWFRDRFNGDHFMWQRDVVASINLLHNEYSPCDPLPDDLVAAFNQWQAAEHAAFVARLDANPDRYGIISPDDSIRQPPAAVRGGWYWPGRGWIVNGSEPRPSWTRGELLALCEAATDADRPRMDAARLARLAVTREAAS